MQRGYREPEDFAQLTLAKGEDGYLVRLGDVARVERAAEERRSYLRSNGEPNVGLGIIKTSTANSLDVARAARATAAEIQKTLPEGMEIFVAFDSTVFIDAAVERVYMTLLEAIALVVVVIYLFLGSARSALIPAVTIPVCLVTAFAALWAFGFSINLLTLLAIVLCIGLVVDDAIVVVENIQRRADRGEPPLVAAKRGTAQVSFAVVATTAVLVAVFLPVGFMEGNIGRLFRELSVAMASAVAISCFVALTLTPMMSSMLVRPHSEPSGLNAWIDRQFARVAGRYRSQVERTIGKPVLFGAVMVVSLVLIVVLFQVVPRELAPDEDRGAFRISIEGPEGAGFDYTVSQIHKVERLLAPMIGEDKPIQRVNTRVPGGFGAGEEMHTGQAIVFLQEWDEREVTTAEIVEELRAKLGTIPAIRATPRVFGGLVRGTGQSLQAVLGGPDYAELAGWRDRMLARMAENPGLQDPDSDYKETRPQMRVDINYDRAADLGVSTEEIGTTLETMMGSRRVTTFVEDGEEYDVVLQAGRQDRTAPAALENIYVRSGRSGELVPLSSLVTLTELAEPGSFNRFNRLRAITLSANLAPGYTLGEAIDWTERTAAEELPDYAQVDYKGAAREYRTAGGAVLFTFAMALRHRLPGARGPVRELHPPARHHADGPARGARRADRARAVGRHAQPLQPDRHRDAGRTRRQERHPDRRLREPAAGRRAKRRGCHRRGDQRATAPDPHDFDRDHGGRRAAGCRRRAGLREPLDHRGRRDLRRGVLDRAFALCRAVLLCAARAIHALPRGAFQAPRDPRAADTRACRARLIRAACRRPCQAGTCWVTS